MKKRALSLVGAVIVSVASASSATAEGLPVIDAQGGTSVLLARDGYEDYVRFDLTVSADDQSLIEEYCTPTSSVLEVNYGDRTSSTLATGDAFVDIGSSGPELFVAIMWASPSLSVGAVTELRPEVLLTCTRMAAGNLPDGFVQVKVSGSTVVGFVPIDADLDPVDEASWTADTRLYQGLQPCLSADSSLVEVFTASLMVDNGRYYNPVTVVRNLGNNNAPVVELAIDDAMRELDSFEVRVICVTTQRAYSYNTFADLRSTSTDTVIGTLEVYTNGSKGQLVLSPCPANAQVRFAQVSDASATIEFLDPMQSGDEVTVPFEVEFADPNNPPIERTFKMTCYVDGPPPIAVTGVGSGEISPDEPDNNDQNNNDQGGVTPDTVAAAPVAGTVTIAPSPIVLGSNVTVSSNAPCPANTDLVAWFPADFGVLENDLDSGVVNVEKLMPPFGSELSPGGDGTWVWNFATSSGALTGSDTYELEVYFVCGALNPDSVLARYEAATLQFVEPDGEVTTQGAEPDGDATGSDSPEPSPSSDPTPRFEVVPAPAPSSSGGASSSGDDDAGTTADDDAESTGDGSAADTVRAFDFDIERQAIVDTATGAAVGVFDPDTGNFVSPDDGSLIAVTDPSNGQVTVLATGDVVARILGSSTDDGADDDGGTDDGDGSSSNTLAYILIGAAGLLLLLLGAFWLGNRGRARTVAPPVVAPSSPAPSQPAAPKPAAPSTPEPTSTLPPPPPPATPDVSSPSDPDATPPGGTPTT